MVRISEKNYEKKFKKLRRKSFVIRHFSHQFSSRFALVLSAKGTCLSPFTIPRDPMPETKRDETIEFAIATPKPPECLCR